VATSDASIAPSSAGVSPSKTCPTAKADREIASRLYPPYTSALALSDGSSRTHLKCNDDLAPCQRAEHMRHVAVGGRRDVTSPQVVSISRIEASRDWREFDVEGGGIGSSLITRSGLNSYAIGIMIFWKA